MARTINLSTPECGVSDGMELTFRAPCSSSEGTTILLDGVTYTLVDSNGYQSELCGEFFAADKMVSVVIDMKHKKAVVLNPQMNYYTKTLGTPNDSPTVNGQNLWGRVKYNEKYALPGKSDVGHTHTKEEITDFAHNHDDRYYTEDEVEAKLATKSDNGHAHDGRYYVKAEIDNALSNKSDNGHQHTTADITDFPTSMPASDVHEWAKASEKPTYTSDEVGAASAGHSHGEFDEYNSRVGTLETWKTGVENGTTVVPNALRDGNGNVISSTYVSRNALRNLKQYIHAPTPKRNDDGSISITFTPVSTDLTDITAIGGSIIVDTKQNNVGDYLATLNFNIPVGEIPESGGGYLNRISEEAYVATVTTNGNVTYPVIAHFNLSATLSGGMVTVTISSLTATVVESERLSSRVPTVNKVNKLMLYYC